MSHEHQEAPAIAPASLKQPREQAGLSQDALAQRLGVAKFTVQRWESGASHPDEATWTRIREALQRAPLGLYLFNAYRAR